MLNRIWRASKKGICPTALFYFTTVKDAIKVIKSEEMFIILCENWLDMSEDFAKKQDIPYPVEYL